MLQVLERINAPQVYPIWYASAGKFSGFAQDGLNLADCAWWLLGLSTAFHPQADGQTEHVNQEVEKYLRIFISHRQDDWADWLPIADLFMILYGRNPRILPNSPRPADSKVPAASDFSKVMTKIHKERETTLEEATSRMKAQYDKHKRPAKEYQLGNLIWLDTANLHLPRPKKKLNDK
ncbi:uncharacterized protein ARMOST_22230 [Armillaria ostoyae]|uniref:Integrase catalytic domain-containing protein n=1 Tax=Armillaria ostoyae TaxID=47428 RepID=A0A284SCA0_ARMOS|nr:uncharacterized protein ARMOST_22230 [Armillaria ostoyae]